MPQTDTLIIVRRVGASAKMVYLAWFDPALVRKWIAATPEAAQLVEVDPRVGGGFRLETLDAAGLAQVERGFFMEMTPGRRIIQTWNYQGPNAALTSFETQVTVDLRSVEPDVTQLTITHSRLLTEADRDHYNDAWNDRVDRLDVLLGNGGR
jgi:uncharacterized protein YndB with AHSA1/START domain